MHGWASLVNPHLFQEEKRDELSSEDSNSDLEAEASELGEEGQSFLELAFQSPLNSARGG